MRWRVVVWVSMGIAVLIGAVNTYSFLFRANRPIGYGDTLVEAGASPASAALIGFLLSSAINFLWVFAVVSLVNGIVLLLRKGVRQSNGKNGH